uniref:Apolipoprotein A-V n=1 Tax=Bubo bubo TaxID=30461 RepID=A0A8C0EEE0_BUBBB
MKVWLVFVSQGLLSCFPSASLSKVKRSLCHSLRADSQPSAVNFFVSVTRPAVSCRNLKGSIQDGVSYVGNFLEKLAPLNRGLQPRLDHDSDSLRKLVRKELESLRVKLAPYVDEVHHKVGKHLDDLRYRLQPFTEELLDQGADEQVKDIFHPYADRLVTEIHRNVEELHRNVVPHAQASPEQLNQYIQELSAKLTQNARDLHQKIQRNLEQLKEKLSLYPGSLRQNTIICLVVTV